MSLLDRAVDHLTRPAWGPVAPLHLYVAVASLALSVYAITASHVINPDGALYVSQARLFAAGEWAAADALYHWPFYSLVIAAGIRLTGLDGIVVAHVIDTVLVTASLLLFVSILSRLTNDRLVVVAGAVLIVLHPILNELRWVVIRDHGFVTFYLAVVWLVLADLDSPRLWRKLAIGAAIALTTAFRFEGAFLVANVPLLYWILKARSWPGVAAVLAVGAVATMALPLGRVVWGLVGSPEQLLAAMREPIGFVSDLARAALATVEPRIETLKNTILYPLEHDNAEEAYVVIGIYLALAAIWRGTTPLYLLLCALAFVPRRLVTVDRGLFAILWFMLANLLVLLSNGLAALHVEWRHALVFGVLATIPAAFTLAAAARATSSSIVGWRRLALPAAIVAVVVNLIVFLPSRATDTYIKDAAAWIRDNVAAEASLISNSTTLMFYVGRYTSGHPFDVEFIDQRDTMALLDGLDYVAIQFTQRQRAQEAWLRSQIGREPVLMLTNRRGHHLLVFDLRKR